MNYNQVLSYGSVGKYGSAWDTTSGTGAITSLRMTVQNIGSYSTSASVESSDSGVGSWSTFHDFGSFNVGQSKYVQRIPGDELQYWRVHGTTYSGSNQALIECWGTQRNDPRE